MNKPFDRLAMRLAMRVENDLWCAYYAMPGTMKDAIFLGSIRMIAVQDKNRKKAFMNLMKDTITDILAEKGYEVVWPNPPQPAPERKVREEGTHDKS